MHVAVGRHGAQGPPQSTPASFWFWILSEHEAEGVCTHGFAHGPPQSTPVSFWFWRPSKQVGAQGGQLGPPQSVPISPLFLMPSEHVPVFAADGGVEGADPEEEEDALLFCAAPSLVVSAME